MYKPLRIRAYMQTGIISDQFLPLDSIIYNYVVADTVGDKIIGKSHESTVRDYAGIRLPFSTKLAGKPEHFYSCSFAVWAPNTYEDQQTYSKRFDIQYSEIIDFGKKMAKVDTSRGAFKGYHIKVYYRTTEYVEWYCHGEQEEIEKYIKFISHIGSKTGQGWGAVIRWEIMEWHEDWSVRGLNGNRLMRAVPCHENGFLYGLRPSYWNPKHQFLCRMPSMNFNLGQTTK